MFVIRLDNKVTAAKTPLDEFRVKFAHVQLRDELFAAIRQSAVDAKHSVCVARFAVSLDPGKRVRFGNYIVVIRQCRKIIHSLNLLRRFETYRICFFHNDLPKE